MSSNLEAQRVTKSNKLIEAEILEKTTKLTLRDQKIILAVISKVSPEDEAFKNYQIKISELTDLSKINKNNLYREIDASCSRLLTSIFYIPEPSEPGGFAKTTWCADAEYFPSKGYVEFSISPKLKKYLLKVKDSFTTYHLHQVVSLKSVYSIRLYELMRQFLPLKSVKLGQTKAYRTIDLLKLRSLLGLDPKKYQQYTEFRRNILKKTQDELKEKTDIYFYFEVIREGRAVKDIKFTIVQNEQFIPVDDAQEAELLPEGYDEVIANMLTGMVPELPIETVNLLASRLDAVSVSQALFGYTKAKQEGKIKNPAAYFLGILKHQDQQTPQVNDGPRDHNDRSWGDIDLGDEL